MDECQNGQFMDQSPKLVDSADDDLPCEFGCGVASECCQIFRVTPCLLFWLCCSSFTQGLLVNGFINSVITSLERRFNLKSMDTGFIASMYDLACLLFLLPVSYIGGQGRKSRWLSMGMISMGIGSIIFFIPHFYAGSYNPQTREEPLCGNNISLSNCELENEDNIEDLSRFKWVFFLGQFLHGVGGAPLYTLGVTYLDDNLTKKNSALFIGIFTTMSLLGPAAGFILGGIFLRIHVDLVTESKVTVKDSEVYVGAWWIGFVISAIFAFISAIPLFGFPNHFPGTRKLLEDRKIEISENTETLKSSVLKKSLKYHLKENISSVRSSLTRSISNVSEDEKPTAISLNYKQFLPCLKIILKNSIFVLISVASASEALNIGGCATFMAKYLETEFGITSDWAPIIIGLCTIPAGGMGIFLGGLIIKVTDMTLKRILLLQMITSLICLPFVLTFVVNCEDDHTERSYNIRSHQANLTLNCNFKCDCVNDHQQFYPVCGGNNVNYFNPCYAGCTEKNNSNYFNCSCVNQNSNMSDGTAVKGVCAKECDQKPIFLALFSAYMFCTFFLTTPMLTSSLRSVQLELRSFAMGIQWIIIRIFGSIPGPLLIGILIDTACNVWQSTCSDKGNCAFYDVGKLRRMFLYSGICIKLVTSSCLVIAFCLYKPPRKTGKSNEDVSAHQVEESHVARKS